MTSQQRVFAISRQLTDALMAAAVVGGKAAGLIRLNRLGLRALHDMQDFEFTVEESTLHILQTRAGKRTPWAALQIAVDLARSGLIERAVAVRRLAAARCCDGTDCARRGARAGAGAHGAGDSRAVASGDR